jgi:hypothetical protein
MELKFSPISALLYNFRKKVFLSSDFVARPQSQNAVISDLFVWRSDKFWDTYFELLDVYGLITCDLDSSPERKTIFKFFTKDGGMLFEKIIDGNNFARNTIFIKNLLDNSGIDKQAFGDYGTFSVFHSIDKPLDFGSSLTDRGYCGYKLNGFDFRGYVHGNFDAISRSGNNLELLMGHGKLRQSYNLQHILTGPSTYEIALVNPTDKQQDVKIKITNIKSETYDKYSIPSKGIEIIKVKVLDNQTSRIKIISKMFMARPTVFRYTSNSMDVFHG